MFGGGWGMWLVLFVGSGVIALGGAQVDVEKVERAARNLSSPCFHFFLIPVAVETNGAVG